MVIILPEIELTADGSPTLRHPLLGEYYHSNRGAVGESLHVFVKAGYQWFYENLLARKANAKEEAQKRPVRIFEVGFGSGLNALLTAQEAARAGWPVEYYALELFPVDEAIAEKVNYGAPELMRKLHRAPWEQMVQITPEFSLHKIAASMTEYKPDMTFDVIYFDAFAPEAQPEMWTTEVFRKLRRRCSRNGTLVTYSSKGLVKNNLREAGFEVKRLPGALGKRHMVRAVKRA